MTAQVLHAAYEMLSINEVTIAVDDRLNLAFASWWVCFLFPLPLQLL